MYSFKNDYNQTCHPNILKELKNLENIQFDGYGLDDICDKAKEKIRKEIENDSDIHFIAGGTLTNLIVISSILRPYEAVISCDSGHINVHETGAIEAVGHKIITLKNDDGKLNANEVKKVFENHFNDETLTYCKT